MKYDDIKLLTDRLTSLAPEKTVFEMAELFRRVSDLKRPLSQSSKIPGGASVGIWRLDKAARMFRRDSRQHAEFEDWAPMLEFPERAIGKRRIVLLGESIAKGAFYEPCYTPAIALEKLLSTETVTQLETEFGPSFRDAEVLDLAKLGQSEEGLFELLRALPELNPDAVVIAAGNNWRVSVQDLGREAMAEALEGGLEFSDLREVCENELFVCAERVAKKISEVQRSLKIPIVFVIPEFNLREWRSPQGTRLAPYLEDDGNSKWLRLRDLADEALSKSRFLTAERLAKQMLTLDLGSAPVTFEILGEASLGRGKSDDARSFFESAGGATALFGAGTVSPRCTRGVAERLRLVFDNSDVRVVDLPKLFKSSLGGALPGDSLLLDYCHLTSEGLALLVAAVADALSWPDKATRAHTNARVQRIARHVERPLPKVEAAALVIAGIHCLHRGQSPEMARLRFARALEVDPESARKILTLSIRYRSSGAADAVTEDFHKLLAMTPQFKWQFVPPEKTYKVLDWGMLELMNEALQDHDVELESAKRLAQSYGVGEDWLELTDFVFAYQSFATFEIRSKVKNQTAYFRSFNSRTKFRFYGHAKNSLEATLTARIPSFESVRQSVDVFLNGERISRLSISGDWKTMAIKIPTRLVREGLNEVEVMWPKRLMSSEAALEKAIDILRFGGDEPLFHVFGEIFSFRIRSHRQK